MRIGIDVGGTKIIAGIVDKDGNVTYKKKIPTEKKRGYSGIIDGIIGLVNDILRENGIAKEKIERIGIASAGQIDKDSKNIIFSPNLGLHNVPLRDDIEGACGIETFIENDVNAATYGEWKFGLNEKPNDVLGIFIGTGIGGGLIIDKELYRGFSCVGGEVGHITVNPYGYKCHCGNSGCFEAYCGGSYIVERVKKGIRGGYRGKIWDVINGNIEMLHAGHIEEAYLVGDDLCGEIWQEVIVYMGTALASLINLLNPEIIILGGGVIYGTKYLVDETKQVMEKRAMPASLRGLRVEKARFGEEAAVMGAAFIEE
jgi:glucokinase